MAAAVSKIMRVQDLITVAAKCRVVTRFRNTIGLEGRMSTRLQPNHPVDDRQAIAAVIIEGLMYGVGDAVIGINPAGDSLETMIGLLDLIETIRIGSGAPIRSCVLAHITTALAAAWSVARRSIWFFNPSPEPKRPTRPSDFPGHSG